MLKVELPTHIPVDRESFTSISNPLNVVLFALSLTIPNTFDELGIYVVVIFARVPLPHVCLLYTSDAADDLLCVDLGGRRLINKKKKKIHCT